MPVRLSRPPWSSSLILIRQHIPLPAGLLLFLSGLAGIGVLGRYKAKQSAPAAA